MPEVEAVGVSPFGPDPGVQVQLMAAAAPGLLMEPAHQPIGMAAPAQRRPGDQVVDVEEPPPREALADEEAGRGGGILLAGLEGGDQAVAIRSLSLDLCDERIGRPPGSD